MKKNILTKLAEELDFEALDVTRIYPDDYDFAISKAIEAIARAIRKVESSNKSEDGK